MTTLTQVTPLLGGILVGGRATRMGGHPKGLLRVPGTDRTIVEALTAVLQALGADVVLAGDHRAYAALGLSILADAPGVQGPAAGLLPLLDQALVRKAALVIVVACDAPFLDADTLAPLVGACASEGAPAAAFVDAEGRWLPLPSVFRPNEARFVLRTRLERGERSLHGLLEALGARMVPITDLQQGAIRDWDTWDDVER